LAALLCSCSGASVAKPSGVEPAPIAPPPAVADRGEPAIQVTAYEVGRLRRGGYVDLPSPAIEALTATGYESSPLDFGAPASPLVGSTAVADYTMGVGLRARRTAPPTARLAPATSTGDLDKAIIRRYMKRQLAKFQYCYERESPTGSDKVLVTFMIASDGKVAAATATADRDVRVADCVRGVVKDIEFPRPKSGTVDVIQPIEYARPTP
jgi:hypothetical protein